ncbi:MULTISPECIES: sugar phosphate isomerase/epimerase family protein [unclassified Inquilinus]|uniref:sugar phosphate isomerase/epimerase family protein n=1 Tax=unclassified Inquilinus TaxID=2645927 RepID=UPI003F90A95A
MKVAAISYCFNSRPLAEAMDRIKAAGYDHFEIWSRHPGAEADYRDQSEERAGELRQQAADRGLSIVSYCAGDVQATDNDRIPHLFSFCRALGATVVNGDFVAPETLAILDAEAEKSGLRFCVENHLNSPRFERPEQLRSVLAQSSPAIGINIDISHLVAAGFDPVTTIDGFFDRLYHVQFEDNSRTDELGFALYGHGVAKLDKVVRLLADRRYSGILSVEHHEEYPYDPDAALKVARAYIETHRSAPHYSN